MAAELEPLPSRRRARLGFWLGGIYLCLAATVYIITALTTTPGKVGYDWIPFVLLAMPWSGLDQAFAIPGVLINTVLLWALGTSAQVLIRNFRRG